MKALFRFADWPLRAKMAVLLVAASLLPLGVSTWISANNARTQLHQDASVLLAARADQFVAQVDLFIRSRSGTVDLLAQTRPSLALLKARPAEAVMLKPAVRALLQLWPSSDSGIRGVAILDAAGTVVVGTEDALIGKSLAHHGFVRQVQRGAVVVSDVYLAEPEVGGAPVIAFVAPMWGDGQELLGMAALWVRASVLTDMLKAANGPADSSTFGVLFDEFGIRIAHTYLEELVFRPGARLEPATIEALVAERRFGAGTRGLLTEVRPVSDNFQLTARAAPAGVFRGFASASDESNFVVARRVKPVQWTVYFMTPERLLHAQFLRIIREKSKFAALIMLAALAVGTLFAAVILKPIRSLSVAARAIADGDLGARTAIKRKDELGELGATFNVMATRLQEQAAELVRESEAQYRKLFESMVEGFCTAEVIFGADGNAEDILYLEVNPAFEKQTGLINAAGKRMCELVPVQGHPWFQIFGRVALTGEPMRFDGEAKSLRRHLDMRAYRIGGSDSRKIAILANDITEQFAAQRRLQAQLERLDLLQQITRAIGERQDLESIFQVVIRKLEDRLPIDFGCLCLYEPDQNHLVVSRVGSHGEQLAVELGLTEHARISTLENGLARCVRGQLVYEPDVSAVAFPFPQRLAQAGLRSFVAAPLLVESEVFGVLIATRREAGGFTSGECEFLRQLSEHVALAAHQAQLYAALQAAYEDLRETQQAAMQQERLRSLGQMASGIAHDINNAISPVALYTDSLLEREPNISEQGRDQLQTIQRAIHDVAATVSRMREFYRQREPQLILAPVQLNDLVPQVVALTRARWSSMAQQRGVTIETSTDLDAELPFIMGAASEIREALTNLVLNAVDAMPQGGLLTLRTCVVEPGYVQLEVADTGVGMDEAARERCLEPFFTTKGERGTGLGLAMVYGVAQRHSAEIEIHSALGKGTTVKLRFGAALSAVVAGEPESGAVPANSRILIVDDDPVLLRSLRDTLEADGHTVVAANGGKDGIDQFRIAMAGSKPFDVVITDLGMPYVDGRQVAAGLKGMSPSTPVIMLTGWGQRLMSEGDLPPHVDVVLSKPPKLRDLREALARCVPLAKA